MCDGRRMTYGLPGILRDLDLPHDHDTGADIIPSLLRYLLRISSNLWIAGRPSSGGNRALIFAGWLLVPLWRGSDPKSPGDMSISPKSARQVRAFREVYLSHLPSGLAISAGKYRHLTPQYDYFRKYRFTARLYRDYKPGIPYRHSANGLIISPSQVI